MYCSVAFEVKESLRSYPYDHMDHLSYAFLPFLSQREGKQIFLNDSLLSLLAIIVKEWFIKQMMYKHLRK